MRKKILLAFIVLIVVGIGIQFYINKNSETQTGASQRGAGGRQRTIPVEVENIMTGTISDIGNFTGSLYANSRIIISAKISGKIERIHVNAGDIVKKGDLIAEIEDYEYLYMLEQAKAELGIAEANYNESKSALEIAKKEYERAKDLLQKRIMSTAEYDNVKHRHKIAENKHQSAKHQVDHRKASLNLAKLRLSYTKIYADWTSGADNRIVGEKFAEEGNLISINSPIVSILDNKHLKANIFASEKDYFRISIKDRATIRNSMIPDKIFNGYVSVIEPFLKESIRQGKIEVLVDNNENILKPGMFVNVIIEFEKKDNAIIVPFNSLVSRNQKEGIFIANEDKMKAEFIEVKTGIMQGDLVEIISPENLTGKVVTLGHHLLEHEANIYISNNK